MSTVAAGIVAASNRLNSAIKEHENVGQRLALARRRLTNEEADMITAEAELSAARRALAELLAEMDLT